MEYAIDHPANKVVVAVNCYISTADDIGAGQLQLMPDARLALVILYDPNNPTDKGDYHKLRLRLEEIAAAGGPLVDWHYEGRHGQYEIALMIFSQADIDQLTLGLMIAPSAAGWGSTYPYVLRWLAGEGRATTHGEYIANLQQMGAEWRARAQRVADIAGIDVDSLKEIPMQDARKLVPAKLHEVVFVPMAYFWKAPPTPDTLAINGGTARSGDFRIFYDDPEFGDPVDVLALDYNADLGLHVAYG